MLSLPVFFLSSQANARVLVLGVGGGSVIRQLDVLMDSPVITGVDLDAVHLGIARRWFDVDARRSRLIQADAVNWLASYRGAGFDIVIDDLFGDDNGEPVRAVNVDRKWARCLQGVLNPGGLIVANYIDRSEFRRSSLGSTLGSTMSSTSGSPDVCDQCFRLEHPLYQNCIGVYVPKPASVALWRRNLMDNQQIDAAQKRTALNVTVTHVRSRKQG